MPQLSVLLINPPILDFTACDFWLRPYGLFRVAGWMRPACRLAYFDYLRGSRTDAWGRGNFPSEKVRKPSHFSDIPRNFRRYGRPRAEFRELLRGQGFDLALIQTTMTYWYLGLSEVIEDLRQLSPRTKIVLGGVYSTLCPDHADSLGADLVIRGNELGPLWNLISIEARGGLPFWSPPVGELGVLKLTEGCPFRCTYCAVPLVSPVFSARAEQECLLELKQLVDLGVHHVAFYDDSLLFHSDRILLPFLRKSISLSTELSFHTPNALNARFLSQDVAALMVSAGFRTFFLGLESRAPDWQRATGGKVDSGEFIAAVGHLKRAGAEFIGTYLMLGHPNHDDEQLRASMKLAHESGTRVSLSEFSPVPGTEDASKCGKWADMSEPLSHNKTAFAIRRLGIQRVNRLKLEAKCLNEERRGQ